MPAAAATFALALVLGWPAPASSAGHDEPHTGGVSSLDVYADGPTIHLLLGSHPAGGGPTALHYRRSADGGETWTEPVRVGEGLPAPDRAHRGSDVQVAAAGTRLVAVWQQKGTGKYGGGPLVTALSRDGGKTWEPGPNPSDESSTGSHGFIDIAAAPDGSFHLVWLDARTGVQGLRYARSSDGGETWLTNQTLDPGTCECCWNTVAAGPDGSLAVLYRDKNPRDMALVRSADGGKTWSKPVVLGAFAWEIEACPHVGGGLAVASGGPSPTHHAIVWTGQAAEKGVHVFRSLDRGKTWGQPTRLGGAQGWHADLAAAGNGDVAAVWDAHTPAGLAVLGATSSDGGLTWTEPRRLSGEGASASHPRVVSTPLGFRAFWTERADGQDATWRRHRLGR